LSQIDVLLPIRRPHVPWLIETLTSLEGQVGVDLRIVAVIHPDDQSLASIVRDVGVPTHIVQAPMLGNLGDALNVGLPECSAPFIARIDQDDIAEPERLSLQLAAMQSDATCVALGSSATLIDSDSRVVGIRRVPSDPTDVLRAMRWKSALIHPAAMLRTWAVNEVGGYSSCAERLEDYELWLRLLTVGTIRSLPEPLLRYRVHPSQMTRTNAITREARKALEDARVALAMHRGESTLAARIRHASWSARQIMRRSRYAYLV
jgi:glycosyltransferase involved in cell wall biosynthesis